MKLLPIRRACYPRRVVQGSPNPRHFKFVHRLRLTRRERDLAPSRLSSLAGLSPDVVRNLESVGRVPRLETVERLASALGVSVGWLAYGIEPRDPVPAVSGTFGERLRTARQARGLTQLQVAEQAEITAVVLGTFERERSTPQIDTAERLADALDVSPSWLSFGLGTMDAPPRRRKAPAAAIGTRVL